MPILNGIYADTAFDTKEVLQADLNIANNFLYRQKGQLKLDNTIIEEFLPILLTSVLSNDEVHCPIYFKTMIWASVQ